MDDYLLAVVDPANNASVSVFSGAYHLPGGDLRVDGTPNSDTVSLASGVTQITLDGTTYGYAPGDVARIRIRVHGGNNVITIGSSVSVPVALWGGDGDDTLMTSALNLTYDGGAGTNPTTFFGSSGNDVVTIGSGTVFLGGATIAYKNSAVSLLGLGGDDTFRFNPGAFISGSIDGGNGFNVIDDSAFTSAVSLNLSLSTLTGLGGIFTSIQNFIGGSYSANQVVAPNTPSEFNVTGANSGTVNGMRFSGFGSLVGGSADDSFIFNAAATLSGSIDGGGGRNTLDESDFKKTVAVNLANRTVTGVGKTFYNIQNFISNTYGYGILSGPASGTTFNIIGLNAVNVASMNFINYSSLVGGIGDDVFKFSPGAKLYGRVNGGSGNNTVDVSSTTPGNVTANLATGTVNASVGGNYFVTYSSIQAFIGNNLSGSAIVGPNTTSVFNITGMNVGTVGGVKFSGFGTLNGGTSDSSFVFGAGGSISGSLRGGSGNNTIDESAFLTSPSTNVNTSKITGINGTFGNIQNIIGSGSNYGVLIGPVATTTYNITGTNVTTVGGVTFRNYSSIVAGPGNDNFSFGTGAKLSGSITGGAGTNTLDYSPSGSAVSVFLATSTTTGLGGIYSSIQNFVGGTNPADSIVGPNVANVFNITGTNTGNVGGVPFSGFGSLTGGSNTNTFLFSATGFLSGWIRGAGVTNTVDESAFTRTVSANLMSNTVTGVGKAFFNIQNFISNTTGYGILTGPSVNSTFNITGLNVVNVAGVNFTNFSSLVGGPGSNVFKFNPLTKLSGSVTGGRGSNTVDVSSTTASNITVNLAAGTVSAAVGGSYFLKDSLIQCFVGNNASGSTIVGPNLMSVFNVMGMNAGNVNGVSFSGFGTLIGGSAGNTFAFGAGGSIYGSLIGGGGTNTIDESAYAKTVATNLVSRTITGVGSSLMTFSNIQSIIGSTTNYGILNGPSAGTIYSIVGTNSIAVAGLKFSNYSSIIGGSGNDVFLFGNGAKVAGTINGGGGENWIDYSDYNTGVSVDLASGTSTGVGGGAAGTLLRIQNVRGGLGNDTLIGNSDGNILVGGGGSNTLNGGSGRSLLIGGTGLATINGGSGGDLIIGGYTTLDNTNDALDTILAEWESTDTYSDRIDFIKNGGGLNFTNKLNLGTTVIDNLAANVLTGSTGGKNWYYKGNNTTVTNLQPGEQVN